MKNISDFLNQEYQVYATEIRTKYPEIHYNRYKTLKNFLKNYEYDPFQMMGVFLFFFMNCFIGLVTLYNLNLTSNLAQMLTIALSVIGIVPLLKLTYMAKIKFFGKNNYLIENEITKGFKNKKISEEMHNLIKLELSMDEYKMLSISYDENMNFTYSDILNFIKNKENINKKFQNIEDNKNSIILSEKELLCYQK